MSIPRALSIITICFLLVNCCQCTNLTRSSGLVYYPDPNNSNLPIDSNQNLRLDERARIRIVLTRHIYNSNESYLREPELSYYCTIGVGSPIKMFNVALDTGTSDTWLPYYNWFPFANNVHYSAGYSCKDSSTCQPQNREFSVDYRNTRLTGDTYQDVFTFYEDMEKDDASSLITPHLSFRQNFLTVKDASDEQFRYKPYDGVVGLAPVAQSGSGVRNILLSLQQEQQRRYSSTSNSNMGPIPNQDHQTYQSAPVTRYYNSNQADLMFSLWFNPNQNSRHGAELLLGGIDENRLAGDIYYHKVIGWFEWQLPVNFVMLGGQVISCQNGCVATLDTGANSVVGPQDDVEAIYSDLQAQYDQNSGLRLVDCNRLDQYPILTFRIEDTPYVLLPRHYIRLFRFKESIVCYLAIKPWNNQGWLLGTSFISAYYTVFDFANRRIGFATPR